MKQIIYLFIASILLVSCGGSHTLPTDNISLGHAFAHCLSTGSYWAFIIISAVILAVAILVLRKMDSIDGRSMTWILLAGLALLLIAIFLRPVEVAANTTVEQAARGHFLGY